MAQGPADARPRPDYSLKDYKGPKNDASLHTPPPSSDHRHGDEDAQRKDERRKDEARTGDERSDANIKEEEKNEEDKKEEREEDKEDDEDDVER